MLCAHVALGLPLDSPFDYAVPEEYRQKIAAGMRVWVPLRNQKVLGVVVGFSGKTRFASLKPILKVIDTSPLLDAHMLLFTREISRYYGCSWGEAIEAALPDTLRKGRPLPPSFVPAAALKLGPRKERAAGRRVLIHDIEGRKRWDVYAREIAKSLSAGKSALAIFPDIKAASRAREAIVSATGHAASLVFRKQAGEIEEWLAVKGGSARLVVGTRSAIFAPLCDLGVIIIDDEESPVYKQEQVPHYHVREAAFMRARIERAGLVLGSGSPTLESYYLTRCPGKAKAVYMSVPPEKKMPEVKIVETRRFPSAKGQGNTFLFSKYLHDRIAATLAEKGKILLFLNRRGFATSATCNSCGSVLRCPRCDVNLVYDFEVNELSCHRCNFKCEPPAICPRCNAGYIKYKGMGTQKLESELARIYPQARVARCDTQDARLDIASADIFVSTQHIFKEEEAGFDLIGVLSIDRVLCRPELRAGERVWMILCSLMRLSAGTIIVETALPRHHCFRAAAGHDPSMFYAEELRQRKELGFPPYKHLCLVKLRGKKEDRVREAAAEALEELSRTAGVPPQAKRVEVLSANPAQPPRLRGNYYWQILLKGVSPQAILSRVKSRLKNFRYSGIIVTVDMDPL